MGEVGKETKCPFKEKRTEDLMNNAVMAVDKSLYD